MTEVVKVACAHCNGSGTCRTDGCRTCGYAPSVCKACGGTGVKVINVEKKP